MSVLPTTTSALPAGKLHPSRPALALAISLALREAARRTRSPAIRMFSRATPLFGQNAFTFTKGIALSFIAVVVLPVFLSGGYLALIASDQYASEVRFAVRGGDQSALPALGSLLGVAGASHVQDSMILTDYLHSRDIVEDIDRSLNLRAVYTRPGTDWLSRFNAGEPIEYLVRYWRWHTDVTMDNISGVITVIVRAFTPQDSLALAREVIARSEGLVNELSERSRADALRLAKAELQRAETGLQNKVKAMRDLRNTEQVLDASKTADVMTRMLGELRLQELKLEQDYTVLTRSVTSDSPQARVMKAQISSLKEQITQLGNQMTRTGKPNIPTLSDAIGRFDREQLEEEIAQKQYVAAAATYERARVDLETQQVYLATFLQPVLAQQALYPRRWWIWSIVLAGCLAIWSVGAGMFVLARNYAV